MRVRDVLCFVAIGTLATFLASAASAQSTPDKEKTLSEVIKGAKQEGELVVWGISSLGEDGVKEYGGAFKARFGLENLRFRYDYAGATGEKFSRAVMETRMGLPSTYDALYGPDHRVLALIEAGGVETVKNWELLLPEGVTPALASPGPVRGKAFAFGNRTKANVFNTKLISADEMPRTTRDVGLPKYKGKFYTSPWTTAPIFGILFYSKEEWLEIARGWGRNKVTTIRSGPGVERMMLGEFAFEPMSNAYYVLEHKSKGNPAGLHLFADFTPYTYIFNLVRKNARHPNAAALYSLWATGPEAVQIFEKYTGTGNINIKESKVGAEVMQSAKKMGGKLVAWLDSDKNMEVLEWYATKEGKDYEDQLAVALGLK